jgi:integrase
MLHVENARKGFFEPEQYSAVVKHLPEHLRPLAAIAYITGWRAMSELLSRQWRHVNLAKGWLRLDPGESKNGEGREFPFTPDMRSVLEAQRETVRMIERVRYPLGVCSTGWQPYQGLSLGLADGLQKRRRPRPVGARLSPHCGSQPGAGRRAS